MQRRALDHGDEVGRGARLRGLGEFDRPRRRFSAAATRSTASKAHGLAGAGEIAAEPGDAQARRSRPEASSADGIGATSACAGSCLVAPEHRVVGEREIGDGAGERPDVVEARDERKRAGPRQAPVGRLEAEDAAERARARGSSRWCRSRARSARARRRPPRRSRPTSRRSYASTSCGLRDGPSWAFWPVKS